MSIESALAQGQQKRRKKAARIRKRAAGIAAYDEKYTGTEPVWDGWETWGVDKFMRERARAFNFYNYYTKTSELKESICAWMLANGYTKDDVRAVKRAPDWTPGGTCGTLCSCFNRGMPALHPDAQSWNDKNAGTGGATFRSDELFVREKIAEALAIGRNTAEKVETTEDGETVAKTPGVSPMTRLREKTRLTIITDLDVMLDQWADTKWGTPIKTIPVYEAMRAHGLHAPSCAQVVEWLTKRLNDFTAALEKTDADLVEGYRYLSAPQLKERVEALKKALADVEQFRASAKALRKPREKKMPSALKQVERVKYLKQDNDFKITSINPIRIVGSHRLLAFSVKYRVIYDFVSTSVNGFGVRGTTITNVDEDKSRFIRLRKPEAYLPIALTGSVKAFEKAWDELTTKPGKPNHRLGDHMVLLRVFDEPTA